MLLKPSFVLVLLSVTFGFAQTADDWGSRELFYREKPGDDKLPPIESVAKPAEGTIRQGDKSDAGVATTSPARPLSNKKFKRTGTVAKKSGPGSSSQPTPTTIAGAEARTEVRPSIPIVEHLGLRYSVLLVDAEKDRWERVDSRRTFHKGECIGLELEANRAGYLYVLTKGPNGKWAPLFPRADMEGESEVVKGHVKQRVPEKHCFELDEESGDEHLFVIVSRNPEQVYDLHMAIMRQGTGSTTSPLSPQATLGSQGPTTARLDSRADNLVSELRGRGFKITRIKKPKPGEPEYSVYVVAADPEKKDAVFAEILINHQK
jgi:hypothetical protein